MSLFSSLFAALIPVVDKLDSLYSPYQPFTRPAFPKDTRPLSQMEKDFFKDLNENFWVCDNQVLSYRLPLPLGSPIDTGDQALWGGIYAGMLAIRYYLTGEGAELCERASKGLLLHQTIHKENSPRLIRGVSNDLKTWQDDCSNDSATGHLLGIYFLWKFGPPESRPVCGLLASGLAVEILGHKHSLVDSKGFPTTYGALVNGIKTDPLRLTLGLAIYLVAYEITGSPAFRHAFYTLYEKYSPLVPYPKVKLWGMNNNNDTHRAAIHLMLISMLTTDAKIKEDCRKGLVRLRNLVAKDANVWVNALCSYGIKNNTFFQEDLRVAKIVLSEFTLSDKMFNEGRDNYATPPETPGWKWKPVKWEGTYRAPQPLSRHMVRSQDFFWQRNLFSLDVGSNGGPADSRHNMGDWLCAYWLCRLNGTISSTA